MGVFGDDDSKDKCNVFIVSSNANWGGLVAIPSSILQECHGEDCLLLLDANVYGAPRGWRPLLPGPPPCQPCRQRHFCATVPSSRSRPQRRRNPRC